MSKYLFKPAASLLATIEERPLELGLLIDRSASMSGNVKTVCDGTNQILDVQKTLPGEAFVTTALFSSEIEFIDRHEPIATATYLDRDNYVPNENTALLDAIGQVIGAIDSRGDALPERSRVMLAILTDGAENNSRRFNFETTKELIRARTRSDGWSFILIAPDSAKLALRLGIPLENCMPWVSSADGLLRLFDRLGSSIKSFRLGDQRYALRLRDKS